MLVYVAPSQLNGACEGSQVSFVFHERSDGKLSGSVVAVLDQLYVNLHSLQLTCTGMAI